MTASVKYVLSKRIDALIDRLINKEFRRRLSSDEYGSVTDYRLMTFLENEEKYKDLGRRVSL